MSDSQVTIKLTSDEALVLSHWLERLQMADLSRVVDDPAVWAPIHRIARTLDKALPELFAPDWADLLRDCRRRGMRDPELVVGDGAMGLWRALSEVFPQAKHQRCWVHKTRNVINALPKSAQPGAKKALQEIYNAEDRDYAEKAVKDFGRAYGAKWSKAVKKITDDVDELLAFYDFPAEHWVHLRTTNPIESTFSTVKLRTKVTRGAGSPAAALAMVFRLAESAQARWRAITAPRLVALVRNGARFERGVLVEREQEAAA